jgi:hypothetical protein
MLKMFLKTKYGADTAAKCPDCKELITVGTRGPSNLVEHQGKSKCKATARQKEREQKQKSFTLFQMGIT